MIIQVTKCNLKRKGFVLRSSPLSRNIRVGILRQELIQKPWKSGADWLAQPAIYITHQPRGHTHKKLGLPISIINEEKESHRLIWLGNFPKWKLLALPSSQMTWACVHVTSNQPAHHTESDLVAHACNPSVSPAKWQAKTLVGQLPSRSSKTKTLLKCKARTNTCV